jgi:hypothetical protein
MVSSLACCAGYLGPKVGCSFLNIFKQTLELSPHRHEHFIGYKSSSGKISNNNPSSADFITYTVEELPLIKQTVK